MRAARAFKVHGLPRGQAHVAAKTQVVHVHNDKLLANIVWQSRILSVLEHHMALAKQERIVWEIGLDKELMLLQLLCGIQKAMIGSNHHARRRRIQAQHPPPAPPRYARALSLPLRSSH